MAETRRSRWHWCALLLLGLLLAGCGQGATPTVTPTPPRGSLACFPALDTVPAAASPAISRARAEAIVRDSYLDSQKRIHLGAMIDEYYVTITASGIRQQPTGADPLRDHDAWVLGFINGDGRSYAIIDARTGQFLSGCGGAATAFGTPAPSPSR